MKKMISFFSILIVLSMVVVSCTKDQDTEAPEVTAFKINGQDHDVEVAAGSDMTVMVTFTDNEALQQWKVDIHDAFDGHGHGKTTDFTKFSLQQVFPISGTDAPITQAIAIPANTTAGPYHCIIRAIDAKGNESAFVEIDLIITNVGQAVINVISPDLSQEIDALPGSQLTLTGNITDDVDLVSVKMELAEEDDDHEHGKTISEDPIYEMTWELPGNNDTEWDMSNAQIQIPANTPAGHYMLLISAIESDGHMSIIKGVVHID